MGELRNNAMTSQGTLAILQSMATPSCSVSRIALSGNGYDVGEIAGAVLAIAQTAPHIIHVDVAPYLLEESALGMLRLLPLGASEPASASERRAHERSE